MSESTSQWLGKLRCTTHQARGSDNREEGQVLKVGYERPANICSLDVVNRGHLNPVEGAGEFQWTLRRRGLRLSLRLVSQFQGGGRDVSEDLLLKDECFFDRARGCYKPILFETPLLAYGQPRSDVNCAHVPLWIRKWQRIRWGGVLSGPPHLGPGTSPRETSSCGSLRLGASRPRSQI